MKANTLVKLLCAVVVSLLVIGMAVSCGGDNTLPSVPTTESTPSTDSSAPTVPSTPGTDNSTPDSTVPSTPESTVPSTPESTVPSTPQSVTIEYDPGQGYFENMDDYEHTIPYGSRYNGHPTPLYEGYVFDGWFTDEACTVPMKTATKYEANTTLYAKWRQMFKCIDGSYDHNFGQYEDGQPATCTTPGTKVRYCSYCQGTDTVEGDPPLNHQFKGWTEGFLRKERTCTRPGCGETEFIAYENVTLQLMGSGGLKQLTIDGTWYNSGTGDADLFNGKWDEPGGSGFASNGQSEVLSVTVQLAAPATMDRIYLKGRGIGSVAIQVLYEGDSDYTAVGNSAFLGDAENSKPLEEKVIPYAEVDSARNIVSVKFVQQNPPQGTSTWEEFAFVRVVEEE